MTKSAFARLSRGATLALLLAAPGLTSAAYANDEYATGHETVIRQAANSARTSPLDAAEVQALYARFKSGQNDAFGAAGAPQPSASGRASRVASTVLTEVGPDVVGAGGYQDAVAREIYHPGTGTDW